MLFLRWSGYNIIYKYTAYSDYLVCSGPQHSVDNHYDSVMHCITITLILYNTIMPSQVHELHGVVFNFQLCTESDIQSSSCSL